MDGKNINKSKIFKDDFWLPEGCVSNLISCTDHCSACQLACVSKMFKSAANCDDVWEKFLPLDYNDLINRCVTDNSFLKKLTKKELFFHFMDNPLLIDGGTKVFSLDKESGKKVFTLGPWGLIIIWSDTPRYWNMRHSHDSKFSESAELISVCWLEIRGTIKAAWLSPKTHYGAYLVFKVAHNAYGFHLPIDFVIKHATGETIEQTMNLNIEGVKESQRYKIDSTRAPMFNRIQAIVSRVRRLRMEGESKFPKMRDDGWFEVEIGEFYIGSDEVGEVEVAVMETRNRNWKGGLLIEGIEIRPKVLKNDGKMVMEE